MHVASERTVDKAKALAATELESAAADIEYATARFASPAPIARSDSSSSLPRQPDKRIVLVSVSSVAGRHVAQRAVTSARSRSIPTPAQVDVAAYASVNDVGRVVNPMIVMGQLDGGAMQGIGQALMRAFRLRRDTGQAQTATFLDYALPRASDAPPFRTSMDESTPCRNNAMGVKGVGELGTIGATPAVVNAVLDALARAGVGPALESLQMPLTAHRVWGALKDAAAPQ